MSQSETIGKLAEALAKAQGCMSAAEKDKHNPYFKSTYADLHSVWEACRKPLSENGLAIVQTIDNGGADIYLHTTLMHTSGEWVRSSIPLYLAKKDPQSLASATTYAKRMALSAIVGVSVTEKDDDAEEAMQRAPVQTKHRKYTQDIHGIGDYLEDKGIASEGLEAYLQYLQSITNDSPDITIAKATANEGAMERFKDTFKRWLDKREASR